MSKLVGSATLLAMMLCAGCGNKDFGDGLAREVIEAKPVMLDGEQVILNGEQIQCGVQNDFWDTPTQVGDKTIARLLPKGRELKFFDDVIREAGCQDFSVQMRGEVPVSFGGASEIKDTEQGIKMV